MKKSLIVFAFVFDLVLIVTNALYSTVFFVEAMRQFQQGSNLWWPVMIAGLTLAFGAVSSLRFRTTSWFISFIDRDETKAHNSELRSAELRMKEALKADVQRGRV